MNRLFRLAAASTTAVVIVSLTACSGMSPRQRDTAIGAGVGGVAGSVITGGSPAGAIGGAVIGGVIGNETGKK